LIEILIAIVLVGILSAVAVVGISNLVSKGSNSACTASGDAAKAASAVFFASNNRYPVDFKDLTTGTNAPMALPSGTTPNPAVVGTVAVTNGTWTLTMTPAAAGTGAAPTFGCTNT
ncbi:MAG: type II secretion system protein, partial [Ilumatobacteraceae bacterium]